MVKGAAPGFFRSRLNKLKPLISREAHHWLRGLAKPCGTSNHILSYAPGQGWSIDARDSNAAYGTYQAFVGRGLIAASASYLTALLAPCRPRGFKFSASYRLYTAASIPGTDVPHGWVDETVSGQICGSDPYDDVGAPFSNVWTITSGVTEVGYVAGSAPPMSLPSVPGVIRVAMVEGAWDRAGQNTVAAPSVRDQIKKGPAAMKIEVLSGTLFSPGDQIVDVPLIEDVSCPSSRG
jgi:hypothetical protein